MGMITVTVLGQDNIETKLQLHDVIYAPTMSSNLFSLNAAYDRGYETRMTPGYSIRIFHKDTLVANTVRVGGLFRLKIPTDGDTYAYAAQANEATCELDIGIWHRRMGHLGEDNVKKLANMVDGMKIKVGMTVGVCEACMQGKQTRQPSHKSATRAKEALELVHSDLCGPITPTTFGGAKYYILFIDDYTRMTRIYPLKAKTSADVLERFKEYKAEVEKQTGKQIKRLRTDGGGEYEKWVERYLKESGIIHETTAPYSPEQNGVAERANRTIMERVKATIAEYELDKRLWMELASTIVYLKNRSPTSAVPTGTPYELWHGAKPNLSYLKIIGSTAYVHIPKEKRVKLDVHSRKGIMIGYGGTNQYRIWDLTRKDIVVSRDVVFMEGEPIEHTPTMPMAYIEETETRNNPVTTLPDLDTIRVLPRLPRAQQAPTLVSTESDLEDEPVDPQILLQRSNTDTETETQRASRRSNKGKFTSTKYADEAFDKGKRTHVAKMARNIDPNDEEEPATIQEAIRHPIRGNQWEKAIQDEIKSLIKNHTWDLVPRPRNRQVVTNKFILKHKKNEIGQITRLKARLVARGFSQIYGVDYLDTYAPVVKLASIRILLAIAAIYGLEIHQMDVVTAFLAGELEEEIYMEQPEGFKVGTQDDDLVCLLRKSLYGLKQAPRVWNQRIRRFLESIGFKPTYSDPCVYINDETGVMIAMWVDDLVIFGKDLASIDAVKQQLKEEYEMKDLGELKYFLGIQVHRDKEQKLIHINQSSYNRTVLERFGMTNSKPANTPLPSSVRLIKATMTDVLTEQKEYQSIVGSLMYAMLATRPDLAQCIQQISQYSSKPARPHKKATKHALRYLNGTIDEGITFDGKLGLRLEC